LMYNFGSAYSVYVDASVMSLIAAFSTIFLTRNRLMHLSCFYIVSVYIIV